MFSAPSPSSTLTPEEQASADAAKRDKLASTQDALRLQTDQLFRLFGARSAIFGNTGANTASLGFSSPLSAKV
jgi:hypothetical protein